MTRPTTWTPARTRTAPVCRGITSSEISTTTRCGRRAPGRSKSGLEDMVDAGALPEDRPAEIGVGPHPQQSLGHAEERLAEALAPQPEAEPAPEGGVARRAQHAQSRDVEHPAARRIDRDAGGEQRGIAGIPRVRGDLPIHGAARGA